MATATAPRLPAQARPRPQPAPSNLARINVGDPERLLPVCGGGALAQLGLSRGRAEGLALALAGGALVYRGLTGHCHLYEALGVNTADHGPAASVAAGHGIKVERAVTVLRPAEELYRFWRHFENLPRFMDGLREVRVLDERRSHWVAKGPLGVAVEWDAEIVNERPGAMIAWRSLESSEVDTAGSVHFEPLPGDRGMGVRVELKYDPPTGKAGAVVARLFQTAPEQQIREDLRRFKQLLEAGEIATTVGQTSCRAR
jgi:uncharacterized membrane protein